MHSVYTTCLTATLLGLASLTQGHLIMKSPVPFGTDSLNNSPLNDAAIGSTGSDFPCKQRPGVYKISQMNNMPVGDSQTLSFTGSASHGGGTCQLAVSLDHEPTANSTWKLIQVYEGGCPVTAAGNGGTDTFTFKIPQNFPNGQATLAWTWYNRIGNREIYMNCAPITVSGGSDNQDFYNTLPNMYVINLPSSQCGSVESSNQIIPNPGQFVSKGDTADKLASATGPACPAAEAAQTKGVQGNQAAAQSGSSAPASTTAAASASPSSQGDPASMNNGLYTQASAPAVATSPVSTQQAAASDAASPSAGSAGSSGFTTLASPSALSVAMTVPAGNASATAPQYSSYAPVPYTSVAGSSQQASSTAMDGMDGATSAAAPAIATSSSGASPSTGAGASGNTCPTDGAVVCNGPSQFGLCNFGKVVWQDVAAGTTCSNGVIQKRSDLGRREQLGRWFALGLF